MIVSFAMATALVVLFFAGVVANATPWLSWSIFGIGAAFFAIGCARAFVGSMYGGEIRDLAQSPGPSSSPMSSSMPVSACSHASVGTP